MQDQYPEVVVAIVVGTFLALLLVGFVITMLLLYQKRQNRQEQEILQAKLEIQEQVFKNISEELHDNIGQILSVLKLTLSVAPIPESHEAYKYLSESKEMVLSVISGVSDLTKSLNTDRMLKIGIVEAVKFELEKIKKTKVFSIQFDPGETSFQLKAENEIFLYRIIQEILNNTIKHSQAKNINVCFEHSDRSIIFSFADDGIGFDVKETLQKTAFNKGIGLSNMMNRARLMGGSFTINSQAGKGTKIRIEIPATVQYPKKEI